MYDKFTHATEVFDKVTAESYYGFNMRATLAQQSPEFLAQLEAFVKECRKGRGANQDARHEPANCPSPGDCCATEDVA